MDYQLTVPAILRRAGALFGATSIVSRRPDRSIHRSTYADLVRRARRLAVGLQALGIRPGDRVGTFCWNHSRHLEAYFGIPSGGPVVHTLNLRLHPDDLAYIVNHAGDRAIIVDDVLLPAFDKFRDRIGNAKVIVIGETGEHAPGDIDYEELIEAADESQFEEVVTDEHQAAAMCYTSGTTGRPKGVVYSHRNVSLHALGLAVSCSLRESDVTLAVVPMFHANAWGLPFGSALVGAAQVLPGPHLDPASLLELLQNEHVTYAAGVPTVWTGLLQALDANPGGYDLSSLRELLVGGSAAPQSMIRGFEERHGLTVVQAWGMTETGPLGSIARLPSRLSALSRDEQYASRVRQGVPGPFIEIRARGDNGLVPWDGESMGELEVRGPWVVSSYYRDEGADRFTDDGWLRTGDIVTIDADGCIQIKDRSKDLIKSGGEWISSVAIESALMDHPAVLEAAVVAVQHPRWDERPLAIIVLRQGMSASVEDLRSFLAPRFAKWWLPDAFEFIPGLPRTATGKVVKHVLREQYRNRFTTQEGDGQAVG